MAAAPNPHEQPFLSLVGRSWNIQASIADACIDFNDRSLAFLTSEGSILIAPMTDPDPVAKRTRLQSDTSRVTIAPRTIQEKPMTEVAAPSGTFLIVVPCLGGGFLAATTNGTLCRVKSDGVCEDFCAELFPDPTAIVTSKNGSRLAVLSGRDIVAIDAAGAVVARATLEQEAFDIAFSPDGTRVAVCDVGGVTIFRISGSDLQEQQRLNLEGRYIAIAWSPTGRFIAIAMHDTGLHMWRLTDGRAYPMSGYPSTSTHFSWGPRDAYLATSGAYRLICWPLDDASIEDDDRKPLETGMKGMMIVTACAAQSKRELVAAGYGNGIVVVCQPGKPDELVLRGAEGEAVSVLKWADDGLSLVIGTVDGFASLVTFPEFMFK